MNQSRSDRDPGSLETLFAFYELVPASEELDLAGEWSATPEDLLTEVQVFAILEDRLGARVLAQHRHPRG